MTKERFRALQRANKRYMAATAMGCRNRHETFDPVRCEQARKDYWALVDDALRPLMIRGGQMANAIQQFCENAAK